MSLRKINRLLAMTSLFLIITTSAVCMDNFQGYIPDEGFVPDEKTAATIATIIWESMHGEPSRGEKYIINLEGNVWHIKGRFILEIDKNTGEILNGEGFGYMVPDEQSAISIAEAVWEPIYGKQIRKSKPYVACLKDGIWYVTGSPPKSIFPIAGGEPYIEIDRETGRILKVYHTK